MSPGSCGYPDASTTGIPAGTTLTSSGCITANKDNEVIQNVSISGCTIVVTANNVTIRNVKVQLASPTKWGIFVVAGASATITHADVSGLDQSSRAVEYAVLSESKSPVSITDSNLHDCEDCIQGEAVTVTDNYIHDMADPSGAHVDGIQCNASCGITVTHNTILNQFDQTSDVALFSDFGTPANSTISNNLLAGGGYIIYGGGPGTSHITITNNRFSTLYYPTGGRWGPVAYYNPTGTGDTFTGNFWDNTGKTANY